MKRILVVEDDPFTQEIYRDILIHAGFLVSIAGCGGDGVACAKEELPDLILMDINLPRINGWEATKMLKGDESTQRIPVVAMSADTAPENYTLAASLGFETFLAKPISPLKMLAEIQGLLENLDSRG